MPKGVYVRKPRDFAKAFWEKVEQRGPDECWPWTGCAFRGGYGRVRRVEGGVVRNRIASRVAYELTHGSFESALCVCHRCDNPICCNPAHLFLGTHRDNAQDMARKGRGGSQSRTHCHRGHAFTPENTAYNPRRVNSRRCRECARINDRARRAKNAAHHPESEAGREIGPNEDARLRAKVVHLPIVGVAA